MSETQPIPTVSLVSELGEPCQVDQPKGRKWPLFAALLSSIVPGSGQLFLGQVLNGSFLFTVFLGILLCFWPLRLLVYYPAFLALVLAWGTLYIYAACSALLARRHSMIPRASRWWLAVVLPVVLLSAELLGAATIRLAGFRAFGVPSTSMEKTISKGDHVVVDTHYYRSHTPKRQDVVVFLRDGTFFVKRVMAAGGDTIEGRNGLILVNGKAILEPYIQHIGEPPSYLNTFGPITVPTGEFFVMGDNRDVSFDSRSPEFGYVDATSIVGKSLYIFGSDRIGESID